ncbi:hypothetical protein BDM02DRAFT_2761246 [Thelephora ganbajun]|uniref:Uncharacterized protein n=1 Tax=Thelephora ganbajun TaxID=370292 RepID=A0ACB6ZSY0_THEGA|nr:hypothetical protein BDM02DRAFT_2761246 [Thelephora ganbajun]
MPPALGFEVADDLSNLKSALEEHQETAAARPKPSRITVDDELFDLEFTPDMTRAGKEAIICERYAIAVSNHKMVEQMLAEAEAEAKQVLWQLTALQPQLSAAHEDMQRFIDEFYALTGQHNIIRQAIFDSEKMAKEAWELDWNEEWICTEDDEKEEDRMREITRARTAGVQLPSSPSPLIPHGPSRKRARDEGEGELEYADDEELQAETQEPNPKRPRVESRETSTAPQSPSPKGRDKGKGRALVAEDSYTLPFPSSPFRMPPPPMPRFGPKDRCNIYPVYKPAVPGYEPPQSPEVEVRNQPEQYDGGHLPPSDEDNDTNDGPELDQGQANGDSAGEEQIGEDEGDNEVESTEERNESATQMPPGGAPSPAKVQPEGPQQGNPWQVLRYDRSVWRGYVVTDHTQMSPDLKRPVNWSVMGPQHPKSASYREWDDELEEQNPWHQGIRGPPRINTCTARDGLRPVYDTTRNMIEGSCDSLFFFPLENNRSYAEIHSASNAGRV